MNGSGAFFLLVVKRRLLRVGCTPRANPFFVILMELASVIRNLIQIHYGKDSEER